MTFYQKEKLTKIKSQWLTMAIINTGFGAQPKV